jgi:hypothetical protein
MDKQVAISEIAAKHLKIKTLETRKSDALDFHQVAVWSIREALEAAFDAGRAASGKPVDQPSRT